MSELETPGHWSETGDMEDPRSFSSPFRAPTSWSFVPWGLGTPCLHGPQRPVLISGFLRGAAGLAPTSSLASGATGAGRGHPGVIRTQQ